MAAPHILPDKALVYATNASGLLVFTEPDFPDVPPQIPGGTIDPGETPRAAARREFAEETGLPAPRDLTFLKDITHRFERDGAPHAVHRAYFHTTLPDDLHATWDHIERFAHDGAPPITFRFHWCLLSAATTYLGLGLSEALPALTHHLAAPG